MREIHFEHNQSVVEHSVNRVQTTQVQCTGPVLSELCSPNVRPQIDCVQSVFLASPLSYLFQVTVLQLAVIIREVSVGLTLGI